MYTEKQFPVNAFFDAFAKGDREGILSTFHPNVTLLAVRPYKEQELYGSYMGMEGVLSFLAQLENLFDTQQFSIEHIINHENVSFSNGMFIHKLKKNGKLYQSEWALYAVIKDDKIFEYHFYEDSARFYELITQA